MLFNKRPQVQPPSGAVRQVLKPKVCDAAKVTSAFLPFLMVAVIACSCQTNSGQSKISYEPEVASICEVSKNEGELSGKKIRLQVTYSPWWESNILTDSRCQDVVYDIYIPAQSPDETTEKFIQEYELTWERSVISYDVEFEASFLSGKDRGNWMGRSGRGIFTDVKIISYKKLRKEPESVVN